MNALPVYRCTPYRAKLTKAGCAAMRKRASEDDPAAERCHDCPGLVEAPPDFLEVRTPAPRKQSGEPLHRRQSWMMRNDRAAAADRFGRTPKPVDAAISAG